MLRPWLEMSTLQQEMQRAETTQAGEVYSWPTLSQRKPFLDVELLAVQNADENHSQVPQVWVGNSHIWAAAVQQAPFHYHCSLRLHPCQLLLYALA